MNRQTVFGIGVGVFVLLCGLAVHAYLLDNLAMVVVGAGLIAINIVYAWVDNRATNTQQTIALDLQTAPTHKLAGHKS